MAGITAKDAQVHYMKPPEYPLREVFAPVILSRLHSASNPTRSLLYRLDVIEACGPYPFDPHKALNLRYLRAKKAAWHAYLYTAFACGLFEGERGKELRGRLTSANDDDFRSAMAECMACWFLAGKLKLPVSPSSPGRDGRELDLGVELPDGSAGVEVKAPYRPLPEEQVHWGDDSDLLKQCMDTANKQFTDECPNILFLVPYLRNRSLLEWRFPLIKAFYGQEKLTFTVDTRTGSAVGPVENRFFPDGKFLSRERPRGRLLKPDGSPAFTRISAVMCVQEQWVERYPFPDPRVLLDEERGGETWPAWDRARQQQLSPDNRVWIEHDCLVMHNPYAPHRLSPDLWRDCVQFVESDGAMRWNDGRDLYGHEVDGADTGGDW